MAKVNFAMRVEPATVEELAALASTMSKRASGAVVTTSDAGRAALERGIGLLRAELADSGGRRRSHPEPRARGGGGGRRRTSVGGRRRAG